MTASTSSVKFYSTRDSAVAVLRKAGIAKADYAKHLVLTGGKFGADVNLELSTSLPETAEPETTAAVTTADTTVDATETVDEEETADALVERAKTRNKENTDRLKNNPFQGLVKEEQPPKKAATKAEVKKTKADAKATAKAQAKDAIAKAAAKKTPKVKKVTEEKASTKNGISEFIRGHIKAGKTNKEILELAEKAGHDLTGKKRYFPAWYRWDLARKEAAAAAE